MPDNVLLTDATKTPDLPPVTAATIVGVIVAVAAAFGLDLSVATQHAILQLATVALVVLPLAESWLRGRRAMAVAHIENARITAAASTAPQSVVITEHPHGDDVATDA